MVSITKEEKEKILQVFPNLHITRTMKQDSKRHHYYCEEHPKAMRWLDNYRNRAVVVERQDNNVVRKTTRRKKVR